MLKTRLQEKNQLQQKQDKNQNTFILENSVTQIKQLSDETLENFSTDDEKTQTFHFNQKNQKSEIKIDNQNDQYQEINVKDHNEKIKKHYNTYIHTKICEKCEKSNDDEFLLLCDYCDDAYHTYCLVPPLRKVPSNEWICDICSNEQKKQKQLEQNKLKRLKRGAQTKINQHFQYIKQPQIQNCDACGEEIAELTEKKLKDQQEFLKEFCIKCQKYFHSKCFNQKKNSIICKQCTMKIKDTLPKNENTILNYFSVVKDLNNKLKFESKNMRISTPNVPQYKQSKKKVQYSSKKKETFKLPKVSLDEQKLIKQKENFYFCLKAKNIEFDDDLRFSQSDCPASRNDATLENNLQKMTAQNLQIFKAFKKMTRNADYPPVLIEESKDQGFLVKAYENIPKLTLISEYVGEVDFARNRIFDKNDSIMDLLRTTRSSTSLVICPEKYGNLARFLSGINNQNAKSKRKQNVQSIRFNIDGHARVLLFAQKNIKEGDILYYDYNAGGFDEYPTNDFV